MTDQEIICLAKLYQSLSIYPGSHIRDMFGDDNWDAGILIASRLPESDCRGWLPYWIVYARGIVTS